MMMTLNGLNVTLRCASPKDAEARFVLGHDADIAEMFGVSRSDVKPMTSEYADHWARGLANNPHAWVIETEDRLIGEIKLHSVNIQDRRASMAIAIYDRAYLGKGLGSEAIRLVLGFAFSDLGLHRVSVRVLAYNTRAIRAYERCGFVTEGRERQTAFVNGAWRDDLMMGLLASEYRSLFGQRGS